MDASFALYDIPLGEAREIVGLPADAVELAAGDSHFCARSADGSVFCFGRNSAGNLGVAVEDLFQSETPVRVDALGKVDQLAAGGFSTCGVAAGETRCVGIIVPQVSSGSAAIVPELAGAGPLVLGGHELDTTGCARRNDASVGCSAPLTAPGGSSWTSLAVSQSSACGLHTDGTAECWGDEYDYDRMTYVKPTPKSAPPFRKLYGNYGYYFGVTENAEVYAWGMRTTAFDEVAAKLWP